MARRRSVAIAAPSRFSAGIIVRLLLVVATLVAVCALILAVAGGFFTYRILTDYNDTENVNPSSFLLSNYESLNFTDSFGEEHAGWLLRGLKGAPAVILCHGYDSNRSELLSLATVLQENHFNVYLFNFHGVKPSHRLSDLGVRQVRIIQSAIEKVIKQPGINPRRLGLFGKNVSGFAVLAAAEQNPQVQSLVVDNAYESPLQMFNTLIDQVLGSTPLFRVVMGWEFRLLNLTTRTPPVGRDFSKLDPVPKLFISGRDVPPLAAITEDFYNRAGQPKRLLVMDHTQPAFVTGTEKKEYENQILTFYLQNLHLRAD